MGLWSRREVFAVGLLAAGSAYGAGQGSRFDQEEFELADDLTGRALTRLTNPDVLFHLPHYHHKTFSSNGRFAILGGEPDGTRQLHYFDLRRSRATQLTAGADTFTHAGTLDQDEHELYFLQGDSLKQTSLRGRGEHRLFRCPSGWRFTGHMDLASLSRTVAVVEIREDDYRDDPAEQVAIRPQCRIRAIELESGKDSIVAAERAWLTHPRFRPRRRELLYSHQEPGDAAGGRLVWTSIDEKNEKLIVPSAGGRIERAYWSTGGEEIRFIHYPDESMRGATIQGIAPETGEERRISRCSAFGWLQENVDGSAFAGASRRPSGPNIYVLFPRLDREITLCEHGASGKPYPIAGSDRLDYDCSTPETAFSHNSQWVYFTSDRDGKPALYRMDVEDLVEAT